ncbi:MAG: PadR family transcriptional regulator [Gammaproteobacteria bacterium]|nr:PadR family transcriptional regulator [Pseudomonadales bacterium]MCP5346502.1 PadR family transcriptional regulator [Pseudomonadales bacterium]
MKQTGKNSSLGEFEHIVLLTLIRLGDQAYGMSVRSKINQLIKRDISIGAIYTTLDRLEDKGYVKSRLGEATARRGGRAKKYFSVTASGRRVLKEVRANLEVLWEGVQLSAPLAAGNGR